MEVKAGEYQQVCWVSELQGGGGGVGADILPLSHTSGVQLVLSVKGYGVHISFDKRPHSMRAV